MEVLNGVDVSVATATESYPPVAQESLPVRDIGRLLLRCNDRHGLVAAVSTFLADAGANVVSLDQHSPALSGGTFLQRRIFHLPGLRLRETPWSMTSVNTSHLGSTQISRSQRPPNPSASRSWHPDDHCLLNLLWRNRRGALDMSVVMVISNHPDLADRVRSFGVQLLHVPATKDIRAQAEQRQIDALRDNVDLVVLARYIQIITPQFLNDVGCPVINIHHSLLPSFIGASPYRRAKERGVKLVGATAHYVTEYLE